MKVTARARNIDVLDVESIELAVDGVNPPWIGEPGGYVAGERIEHHSSGAGQGLHALHLDAIVVDNGVHMVFGHAGFAELRSAA